MKLLLISALLVLSACNGGGGGGSAPAATATPNPVPVQNYIVDEHIGLWAKCVNDAPNTRSLLHTFSFSRHSASQNIVFFAGANCQLANAAYEERFVYDVDKYGDKHLAFLDGASTASISASDVTYSNTNSYCGFTNWVQNVPRLTMDRTCGGVIIRSDDIKEFFLSLANGKLTITGMSANPIELQNFHKPNFNHTGTAIPNGGYVYYNSELANFYIISGNNYERYVKNSKTATVQKQTGTFTISGNQVTFTVGSETPNCGKLGQMYSLKYSPSTFAVIFENAKAELLTAELLTWTGTEFGDAYAGFTPSPGCVLGAE